MVITLDTPPCVAERNVTAPANLDIAQYVCEFDSPSEIAWEAAYLCLLEAVVHAIEALKSGECMKLLGPVVPGATMARGSRVIGTSLELDPVQAAFNLGTMIRWRAGGTSDAGHPADHLGALLSIADYRSRRAIATGVRPPSLRDLLLAMIKAYEIRLTMTGDASQEQAAKDPMRCAHVASAALVTHLLGGAQDVITRAFANASAERFSECASATEPELAAYKRRSAGEVASRAVRIALMTCSDALPPPLVPDDIRGRRSHSTSTLGSRGIERLRPLLPSPPDLLRNVDIGLAGHFPAAQYTKIRAMFADRHALAELPVHDFVALLVRN